MSRDYADKDFLRYRSPKKKPWFKRIIFLCILGILIYAFRGHFSQVSEQYQKAKGFLTENKIKAQKKVSGMIPELPKAPKEEDIHFEFYDTLPAMQVKSIAPSHSAGAPPPKLISDSAITDTENVKLNSASATDIQTHIAEEKMKQAVEPSLLKNANVKKTHEEDDELSAEFSEHLKQHQEHAKSARFQILLATFNTQVAAESYRDRLPIGNKISIVRVESGERMQYKVMVMGDLSESQAKTILLKYQKAGWAKQGKIQFQSERGE